MNNPVIIGDATLYLGDALEILPAIDKANYDNSGNMVECDVEFSEIMPLMAACLDQGHAYFMVNNRYVAEAENTALAAGFRFHNWLVWDKSTGTPNRWYMKNCEFTLFVFRGKAKYINDCGSRQLIRCPNVMNGVHETQKPVELFEHYIGNSTDAGDIVLDPFMGSATTGIAAINLGRKFIGIEKDERHFENAVRRIQNETRQSNLFGAAA